MERYSKTGWRTTPKGVGDKTKRTRGLTPNNKDGTHLKKRWMEREDIRRDHGMHERGACHPAKVVRYRKTRAVDARPVTLEEAMAVAGLL